MLPRIRLYRHHDRGAGARGDTVLNEDIAAPNVKGAGGLLERDELIRTVAEFKPDYVINLAAATGVDS